MTAPQPLRVSEPPRMEAVEVAPPPPRVRSRPSPKRALDVVFSLALLLACLPLLVLIALLIRLDSRGPILFRQQRIGLAGQPFHIVKFRTMHVLEDGADVVQAIEGDPRVTRVGGILRITSLDELPQLLNVLSGEMSLVGPRPHAAAHDDYYSARIPNYLYRQNVRPGITGWAQVNGARGATPQVADMQARVDLDAWYVDNANLALDLKILARTPLVVLSRRKAC
ncbi:exopolysaccharide biosynthesis polyprenyl glycosylphosphotransferase [Nitrospirillum sp. BR 11163]|uniref:exopolysaccharide biosynthesis polyprenyl glycosylphosphotransferase n=1 Tax=Nitrospirillum sp. BR 11163 TaxID=3104323 RepID=UPI002AFF6D66|nr:exopolysaccharide biosynthesis polyprenyl glycosylphosphotransferase [Nitrospirillum sp. BR 11163]MEA1671855.1 exopolysaccharide biosynthesis polyprenyl glycosylphosphotransferase [Nitrospirillum sp. BR 11163]